MLDRSPGRTSVIVAFFLVFFGTRGMLAEDIGNESAAERNAPTDSTKSEELEELEELNSAELGIAVRCPKEWVATASLGPAYAFVMRLPADDPEKSPALAICEIGHAPSNLEAYRVRIAKRGEQASRSRRLAALEIIEPGDDGPRFAMLEADWEYAAPGAGTLHQLRRYVIHEDHLYTFTLTADDDSFEKHREAFRKMVETASFGPVRSGLEQRAGGYWVQSEHGFGMRLPDGWKPSFRPTDEVLYSAVGPRSDVFSDSLLVTSSPTGKLDFENLKKTLPSQVQRARANTKVVRCEVVEANGLEMLETVIETKQGPFEFTIVERRIQGKHANYEARFTVIRAHHEKHSTDFTKALDSFREFEKPKEERQL